MLPYICLDLILLMLLYKSKLSDPIELDVYLIEVPIYIIVPLPIFTFSNFRVQERLFPSTRFVQVTGCSLRLTRGFYVPVSCLSRNGWTAQGFICFVFDRCGTPCFQYAFIGTLRLSRRFRTFIPVAPWNQRTCIGCPWLVPFSMGFFLGINADLGTPTGTGTEHDTTSKPASTKHQYCNCLVTLLVSV